MRSLVLLMATAFAVVAAATTVLVGVPEPLAAASEASRPLTLATVPGRVYALAPSARYVAWRACDNVQVSDSGGRRVATIPVRKSPGFGCQELFTPNEGLIDHDILAILGDTVTWSMFGIGNSTDYASFGTAEISDGHGLPSLLPSNLWLSSQTGPAGSYLVGPASDGRDLLYGVTRLANDPACTDAQVSGFTCPLVGRGTIWRVDAQRRRHRLAAAAATLLAFAGGRVAVVPHTEGQPPDLGSRGRYFRQPQPKVRLLQMANGASVGEVELAGEPYELALSATLGAVLVGDHASTPQAHVGNPVQLQWFDPRRSGTADSRAVAVYAEALSIAGNRIIFRAGQRILSYVPGAPRPTLLATAAPSWTVVGPTVAGTRLLWAETGKQRGRLISRIRTLDLS